MIADAHQLTERERALTRLVAHGLATGAIAQRLHISPWTVQDHLKLIFKKLGVSTRGELVARVFSLHATADVLAPKDAGTAGRSGSRKPRRIDGGSPGAGRSAHLRIMIPG